ncbi:hypothetical protein JYU29_05805 [Tianweitania sp. BSSL-BM11]|uniref:Uncharacterized protein n=1 Tax=Tianweitania aestuarii TaxID=2814886 RepID=A0ABS5RT11_9HYPH|nr:hypothetical protein [Tianweitania aestuarii]MBS9720201.1 hypothetical protein [Tianweitania aestuarii]
MATLVGILLILGSAFVGFGSFVAAQGAETVYQQIAAFIQGGTSTIAFVGGVLILQVAGLASRLERWRKEDVDARAVVAQTDTASTASSGGRTHLSELKLSSRRD